MDSRKFFKILQLISSLVGIAVIACAAYFGYGFYKEYKASKGTPTTLTPESSQANASATPTTTPATAPDSAINWDHIMKQTKDSQDSKDFKDAESASDSAKSTPESKKPVIKTLAPKSQKPKAKKPMLAIIMDDMAYRGQLNDLQKLNLPITPSFFPVSPDSPETAVLAASVPFYMVHLPLEAQTSLQTRQKWLLESSSKEEIRNHVEAIKRDFPRLMFINNHTGSRFTANERAMSSLLEVLREFGIEFVDSRTSAETAAPKLYKQARRPLLQRDVFLDNTPTLAYTTSQIKLAIATAKKNGYAIAICHPHQSTFKALANAKYTLFKDVELVYIKDLPIAKSLIAQNLAKAKNSSALTGAISSPESAKTSAPPSASLAPRSEIAEIFEESEAEQNPHSQNLATDATNPTAIPHNDYLDPQTPESTSMAIGDSNGVDSGAIARAGGAQASLESSAPDSGSKDSHTSMNTQNTQSPSQSVKVSKPSQIDHSVFKEVKRQTQAKHQQNRQSAKQGAKGATKPESKSRKGAASFESIKDCEQSEVEAFISGCPSDRIKQEKTQGFINIEWSSEKAQSPAYQSKGERAGIGAESKRPKDFLDSSEF